MDTNFTVTTIYFDGQFWCALIERHLQNQCFVGRYVFGAEPSNPRLIEWMLNEFSGIKLFPVNQNELPKIRLKKIAGKKRTDSQILKSIFRRPKRIPCTEKIRPPKTETETKGRTVEEKTRREKTPEVRTKMNGTSRQSQV